MGSQLEGSAGQAVHLPATAHQKLGSLSLLAGEKLQSSEARLTTPAQIFIILVVAVGM